ncbi:MAG: hypothetical protein QOK40_944 [Miltoncostaeaceae bacterium]|jgi:uncharacterized membrane protein YdbT with pleckstrin-like domain|nr:hypothetical protein [Miltoncostaeaceae bacterium]
MDLVEGERLLWRGHPSWRSRIGWLLRWGLVALLPVIVAGALRAWDKDTGLPYWQWILISLALLVLVVAIDAIRRHATTYSVTTNRLNIRRGILSRSDQSTHLTRLQNLNTDQSVLERVLHVGSIDFDTAGAGTDARESDFRFAGVADPHGLVAMLERHLAAQREDGAQARLP